MVAVFRHAVLIVNKLLVIRQPLELEKAPHNPQNHQFLLQHRGLGITAEFVRIGRCPARCIDPVFRYILELD